MKALARLGCLVGAAAIGRIAEAQELAWRTPISTEPHIIHSIVADGIGGAFVAGSTTGAMGGSNLGGEDAWIARVSRAGHINWIRQHGTGVDDAAQALAPDGAGGVLIAGVTRGDLGGPSAGGQDLWLSRVDAAGAEIWIRQHGTARDESLVGFVTDGSGGAFGLWLRWNGASVEGESLGRFDSSGNVVWEQSFLPWIAAIAPDDAGGVYLGAVGTWSHVIRLDGTGAGLWTAQLGHFLHRRRLTALAPDGEGGVFAIGWVDCQIQGACGPPWRVRLDAQGAEAWLVDDNPLSALAPESSGGLFIGGPVLNRYDQGGTLARSTADVGGVIGVLTPAGFHAAFAAAGSSPGASDPTLSLYVPCYVNCDESAQPPVLNVADFACFLQRFAAGSPYANCDQSTTPPLLNVADFVCFLQRFAGGCPQ